MDQHTALSNGLSFRERNVDERKPCRQAATRVQTAFSADAKNVDEKRLNLPAQAFSDSVDWLEAMNEEHAVVLKLTNVLKIYADKIESEKKMPPETLKETLELVKKFADKCHHGKEEKVLFPLLNKKSPRNKKTTDILLNEHDVGRTLVREMETGRKDAVIKNARRYAELLAGHIAEETVFYREINETLAKNEKEKLAEEFEKIEREEIGEGKHEEYMNKAKEIEEKLRKIP